MDTQTINGLHSCKPGNDPIVGQVKLFVIQHMTSKKGKPYIKIKSANEENGGTPHRILAAEPSMTAEGTQFTDKFGNVSYNMEVEASSSPPSAFQQTKAAMQQGNRSEEIKSKGEHFLNEPDSDWPEAPPIATEPQPKRFSMLDERQRAIIRQHSQTAAIEVLKLKQMLGELTVEDLTPSKLSQLANFFDADVFQAASNV